MPDTNTNKFPTLKERMLGFVSRKFVGNVVATVLSTMTAWKWFQTLSSDNSRLIFLGIYFTFLASIWGIYSFVNYMKSKVLK